MNNLQGSTYEDFKPYMAPKLSTFIEDSVKAQLEKDEMQATVEKHFKENLYNQICDGCGKRSFEPLTYHANEEGYCHECELGDQDPFVEGRYLDEIL